MVISKDTDFFVHGDGSIKLTWDDAQDDRAEFDLEFEGLIKKVIFYCRSSRIGTFATVGIGLTNFDENTIRLNVPTSQFFFAFEWDVSGLDLRKISKFAIQVDDVGSTGEGQETFLDIDKIMFEVAGNRF